MARKKQKKEVSLPWERRGSWLREGWAGQRWKMLVVTGVTLLAAVGLWRSADHRTRTRDTQAEIVEVKRAIASFRTEVGRCPRSIVELVHPPEPAHRYLREVPRDGWGNKLWVQCPARHDPHEAEVVSAGPSGSFLEDDNVM